MPGLDQRLSTLFDPAHLGHTIDTLVDAAASSAPTDDDLARDRAREQLAQLDRQLARYGATLDAGADPAVVARWIAEIQAKRTLVKQTLTPPGESARMSRNEIADLVRNLGDLYATIRAAHPEDKAEIYRHLASP